MIPSTNINPRSKDAYRLMHDGILALSRAEQIGFRINRKYVRKQIENLEKKIQLKEKKFKSSKFYKDWDKSTRSTININSNTQLSKYLYNTLKLTPADTTNTGQGSTSDSSLAKLNIEELNNLLKIRKLKKAKSTYFEAFLREQTNGILHPFYNLHTVQTYRSSSDSPNFQNIPIRDPEIGPLIRKAIYPRKGNMLAEIDFSSLEVRVAACYHKDPNMLNYLRTGHDMHGDVAMQIFGLKKFNDKIKGYKTLRKATKNSFVFPQFYGDYYGNNAKGFCENWLDLPQSKWTKGMGIEVGKYHISDYLLRKNIRSFNSFGAHLKHIQDDFWNNRFPVYRDWKDATWELYLKYGYVPLKTGFVCSGLLEKNQVNNWPIQGSGFHCELWSLIQLDFQMRVRQLNTRIISQIHDSIILDIVPDEYEEVIKLALEITTEQLPNEWDWIITPLEVDVEVCDVDKSWSTKEEIRLN